MFKKILATLVLLGGTVGLSAQIVRTFPAEETVNVFKAQNSFPQVNNTLYAGSVTYPTAQGAVTAACALSQNTNVEIPVGTLSSLDPTTLAGCTNVGLIDMRGTVPKYYLWQSGIYVLQSTGGGGAGTVQSIPQFRLFIQPNTGSQAVAGAATTTQDAVTPILQGRINPEFSRTGNNGVANVLASSLCSGLPCVAVTPPDSNSTESFAAYFATDKSLNAFPGTVVGTDQGGTTRVWQDPTPPGASVDGSNITNSPFNYSLFFTRATPAGVHFPNYALRGGFVEALSGGYDEYGPGPNFKSNYSVDSIVTYKHTSGQFTTFNGTVDCTGQGDCDGLNATVNASGGDSGDLTNEGNQAIRPQSIEPSSLQIANVGSSNASSVIIPNLTTPASVGDDGRIEAWGSPILSSTDGCIMTGEGEQGVPATTISLGNAPGKTCVFPSSWMALTTTSFNNSSYPIGAVGTATVTIQTSGVPSGWNTSTSGLASSGFACVSSTGAVTQPDYFETVPYTVLTATTLQMTFLRPHPTVSLIGIGGRCGSILIPNASAFGNTIASIPTNGTMHQAITICGAKGNVIYLCDAARTTAIFQNNSDTGEGEASYQTASISTVVRSSNIVTVTVPAFTPVKGPNVMVFLSGVTDTSFNGPCPLLTIIDGSNFTCSQTGANASSSGGTAIRDAAEYTVVQGAKIQYVMNLATKKIDGTMELYPGPWTPTNGDPLVFPHGNNLKTGIMPNATVTQWTPSPDFGNTGAGGGSINSIIGGRPGPTRDNFLAVQAAAASTYLGFGGTKNPPAAAFGSTGTFDLGVWKWTMASTIGIRGGIYLPVSPAGFMAEPILQWDVPGGLGQWMIDPINRRTWYKCTTGGSGNCSLGVQNGSMFFDNNFMDFWFQASTTVFIPVAVSGVRVGSVGSGNAPGINFSAGTDPRTPGANICSTTLNEIFVDINAGCFGPNGTLRVATKSPLDSSTAVATTAYVDAAVTAGGGGGGGGFPFTLGSTSIAASSHVTAVTGLSVNGVTLDATGGTGLFLNKSGTYTAPPGTGTVTNVSGSGIFGLFSMSIASPTTTPTITFTLASQAAFTLYGNFTGSSAAPTFSTTPVIPSGATGTTQSPLSNNTKLATTSYVDSAVTSGISGFITHSAGALTGGSFMLGNGGADSKVSTNVDEGITTASRFTFKLPINVNDTVNPSGVFYVPNSVAPAVSSGAAGWGVGATLTTAGFYKMPDAPCSGFVTFANSSGIVTTTCNPVTFTVLTDSTTVTWAAGSLALANASLLFTTHGGSRTLNVSGLVDGGSYELEITQDGTGGEGLTLGTGCTWKVIGGGSGAITPSTGANAIDILAFSYNAASTTCLATFGKNYN